MWIQCVFIIRENFTIVLIIQFIRYKAPLP
jgi:hypothetical protein